VPTFGLETIFQVPFTGVVGPGVGVRNGASVGVGVEMGVWEGAAVAVRVGVRVLLGAACTDRIEAPEVIPIIAPMSSRLLNTINDLLRYF
jgi:hypothetical protein